MSFFQNLVLTKVYQTVLSPPIRWIHNDFMYVRFGEIRNTETWSKFKWGRIALIT